MIHSYSSPLNLGHKNMRDFFDGGYYIVQEKVDGSQISFSVVNGELYMRSRGQQINESNLGMFDKAWETGLKIKDTLHEGWVYRGEYLQKRKHNVIAYDRIPKDYIILFDIDTGDQNYLVYMDVVDEAKRIGLEVVPLIDHTYDAPTQENLRDWLDTESILGGSKIEGVVCKNYRYIDPDGKIMMVKYVSPKFRETHGDKPVTSDIVQNIVQEFGSEARWLKAVQHLRENGKLEDTPKDIGNLFKEVNEDLERECLDDIKQHLWEYYRKAILKGVTGGLAEWYKDYLYNQQVCNEIAQLD